MFGALRAFVVHELGNPSCVVGSLSRTTSLISGFPHLGCDVANCSPTPSRHALAFHSELQANPTRSSSTSFPSLRNGSARLDRNSGLFGNESGAFDRGVAKTTHRHLSADGGKSGGGQSASNGGDTKKSAEDNGAPGGERGGSGEEKEAGQNFEERFNARLVDMVENRLADKTEALKGYAKKMGGLDKLQNDAQPVIVYSPSLYWADDAFGGFIRAMAKGLSWTQSKLIRRFVDDSFSESDFLEGCKDANHMVNQLFGENDWESLKPMVSQKLGMAFRAVGDEFKKQGLSFSMTTENVKDAFIQGFHICESRNLQRFDNSLFKDEDREDDMGHYWLMVAVRMLSKDRFQVSKDDGDLVSDTLHQRTDTWTFVRGPFTALPMEKHESRDMEWTLLSVS
ncbi:hypothetical protein BSKO_07028 [Bryopsis sp. KO-2023]|nr:hypothetical protein BSKO_07028 [Bryopsis sp. KO-2023]